MNINTQQWSIIVYVIYMFNIYKPKVIYKVPYLKEFKAYEHT